MDFSQRRITFLILGLLGFNILITALGAALAPPSFSIGNLAVGPVVFMSLLIGALGVAYARGWEPARHLTVVLISVLVPAGLPEPFITTYAPLVLAIPPILAVAITNARWVVAAAVLELAILLVRGGTIETTYLAPTTLTVFLVIVAMLVLARLSLETALRTVERQRSELSEAFDTLRETDARYRLIAEHTTDTIAILDVSGRILYASPSHQAVLGYPAHTLVGRFVEELIHPEDMRRYVAQEEALRRRGTLPLQARYRHQNGSWRWLDSVLTVAPTAEGGETILIVSRDVTDRRELEREVRQAQKLESVGRLAGGVAHDFNNLLTIMVGAADMVRMMLPEGAPGADELNQIHYAARSGSQLTRQLLAFARKQVTDPVPVQVGEQLMQMDKMLRRLLGADIELVTLFSPDPLWVRVDPGQLEQTMVNLVVNARDAMPEGGTLTIETRSTNLEAATADAMGLTAGDYVEIQVGDTGIGMPPDVQAHIFEPFFTTKEVGTGTGLGLSTCYGIITQHGGCIQVESAEGQGTTFTILLPRIAPSARQRALTPPSFEAVSRAPVGSETVLLAEDEPMARAYIARALRGQGYVVLEAENGDDAIAVLERHAGGPIQLLLTDMVMPKVGGKQLAEQLRARLPGLKVIFMTGYSRGHNGSAAQIAPNGETVLQKPVSMVDIARVVRQVLDSEAAAGAE